MEQHDESPTAGEIHSDIHGNRHGPDATSKVSSSLLTSEQGLKSERSMESGYVGSNGNNMMHRKPNSQLSNEEKEEKRRIKKRIKLQRKISSLKKTIRHAKNRKDVETETAAMITFNELLEKEHDTIQDMQLDLTLEENIISSNDDLDLVALKDRAKSFIIGITSSLFQCSEAQGGTTKNCQKTNAVKLLKHMTKGTQEKVMFQDKTALWGYTRQKFYERALLLCTSLGRIKVDDQLVSSTADDRHQTSFRRKIWDLFQNGRIRKVYSIGCGPGNDLVGLLTFLKLGCREWNAKTLETIVLMDWSMDEWRSAVIHPLSVVLEKQGFHLDGMEMVFCDVTKDLNDHLNNDAREMILWENHASESSHGDIYLISYLLSETREKWVPFFKSLVAKAQAGSMFYFAEPVPWQLHRFMECFRDEMEFLWLDSSMNYPSLQLADRRTGPAVLFAMKC